MLGTREVINGLKELANNPIVHWRASVQLRILPKIVLEYYIIFYIVANIYTENGQNSTNLEGFLKLFECFIHWFAQISQNMPL